ncbi:MAG: PepSY-like domain-containing protein [Bacteroidetes bacterium]|nr:PepSY-like domain-containing protein [Bacteroidota bacterium]
MKTTIVLLAIAAVSFSASAQKIKSEEVPSAVKSKVTSLYPNSKVEKWEKEDGNFEAELEVNKVETSVLLNASGNLLQTETEIASSALPKGVSDYVTKNLAGKKIKEAAKIVDAKNTVTYEAEVDEADYIFDASGNFLKKEVENDNDKDEKKGK